MGHGHSHHGHSHDTLHGGVGHESHGGHGDHGGHGHSHAPRDFGGAFLLAIILNTGFVVVEAVFGILSGSMALVADAGHNLSDVLALLLAWGASVAARRPPSERYTYGFKSSTILAALANALLLAVAIGAILFETVHRMMEPAEPQGMTMAVVAGIGIAINAGTAMLFMRGQEDINIRGAYLHMAADALVSAGVVVAGLLIMFTGIRLIDPIVSLIIVAIIAWGTWGLAKDSLAMGLLAVPARIDAKQVRGHLRSLEGVEDVHDLHIWPMSTTETALTAHLVMPALARDEADRDEFLRAVSTQLRDRFGIGHSTIQVERSRCENCC